jgi:hypothetical protein
MTAATIDHPPDTRPAPAAPADRGKRAGQSPGGRVPYRRLVVLAILVAAVATVWWRFEGTAAEGPAELVLQGNIDVRQVNLSFKVGGRIDALAVDEGDPVKAGQVVATLDPVYFEDDLRLARARRDNARANLERLENGSRPEEIAQARAQTAEREATFNRAGRRRLTAPSRTISAPGSWWRHRPCRGRNLTCAVQPWKRRWPGTGQLASRSGWSRSARGRRTSLLPGPSSVRPRPR